MRRAEFPACRRIRKGHTPRALWALPETAREESMEKWVPDLPWAPLGLEKSLSSKVKDSENLSLETVDVFHQRVDGLSRKFL